MSDPVVCRVCGGVIDYPMLQAMGVCGWCLQGHRERVTDIPNPVYGFSDESEDDNG